MEQDLLKFAIEHGMLDIGSLQQEMEMNKRKTILQKHIYEIWQSKDGEWHTYLPDEKKGRVHRHRKSYDDLEDIIYEFWKEKTDNPTVKELYQEWIQSKLDREEIAITTKNRYDRQYDQCLSEFGKRKVRQITEDEIEDYVLNIIHEKKLTAKGWANTRTILFGVFKKAKKMRYIDWNVVQTIQDIDISRKAFRKIIHEDEELIFMEDEVEVLDSYFKSIKRSIVDLGLMLLFKTGMRSGELAALKKEDIKDNIIHVHRTEIRYEDEDKKYIYEVRDFPKTEAGIRNVIVPIDSIWILKEIEALNPDGEYLFMKNGHRIRTVSFDKRLRYICHKNGIVEKSQNKIRKTYGTMLIDAKVDESLILSQMGHTDIRTTKLHYYKNRKNTVRKAAEINKAFSEAI